MYGLSTRQKACKATFMQYYDQSHQVESSVIYKMMKFIRVVPRKREERNTQKQIYYVNK
jgi:hypothetical protein